MQSLEDIEFQFQVVGVFRMLDHSFRADGSNHEHKEQEATTTTQKTFPHLAAPSMQELYEKWGLVNMFAMRLKFEEVFLRGHARSFLRCLFRCNAVQDEIQKIWYAAKNMPPMAPTPEKRTPIPVTDVNFEYLPCTHTTLGMFDRICGEGPDADQYRGLFVTANAGLSSKSNDQQGMFLGSDQLRIVKCPDRYLENGVVISDRIRELFLCTNAHKDDDNDEEYALELNSAAVLRRQAFTAQQKREFLYHVCWRLVAGGGPLCQYEDDFCILLDATREVYKDLVHVRRNPETAEIETGSDVFLVSGITTEYAPRHTNNSCSVEARVEGLFPTHDLLGNHNFCYVCVAPRKREVVIWYNALDTPY